MGCNYCDWVIFFVVIRVVLICSGIGWKVCRIGGNCFRWEDFLLYGCLCWWGENFVFDSDRLIVYGLG